MDILLFIGAVFCAMGLLFCVALLTGDAPIFLVLFPLLFVLIGGFLVVRSVRRLLTNKRLRENGRRVYAEIVETTLNYHYTINNRPTYILHCEANGVPYEWSYPKTHASDLVGKRSTMYVNPENSEEYFVDLKSITA